MSKPWENDTSLVSFLTPDEQNNLNDEWERYDVDLSGNVTTDEFIEGESKWHERVFGTKITSEELMDKLQFWRRTRDQDGSGEVTWHEYADTKALMILDQRGALMEALTPAEKQDARAAFDMIDKDKGGSICESEARAYFEARAAKDVANNLRTEKQALRHVETQVKTLFTFKDEDGSGTVDFEEFLAEEAKNIIGDRNSEESTSMATLSEADKNANAAGTEEAASVLSEDQIEHARMKFADWDKDGNGTLDVKELQKISKELNLKTTAKQFRTAMKKCFKANDVDGDGLITFEEFLPIYNWLYVSEMEFE